MNLTTTPLVPLQPIELGIYAKIEYLHPSGSMKHRSIPPFLKGLVATGELQSGQQIAIRSAGSAAVTTAWAGKQLGLPVTAVLPPTAMKNVVRMLHWLGATCHQVPKERATEMMQTFAKEPHTYVLAQAREARLIDHYAIVADEILAQLAGVTAVTVGIGTGLSVTGIGRAIKANGNGCHLFGVEPAEAAIASGHAWAAHGIPGLAPPIPQPLLDKTLLTDICTIPSKTAWQQAQMVAQTTGLPLGPSSGATVAAALHLREQGHQGTIVAVCACHISDYLEVAEQWI